MKKNKFHAKFVRAIHELPLLGMFLFMLAVWAFPAHASRLTHLIGTTGYMIREAQQVGAAKKDPQNFQMALKLQKQAKEAFRGKARKGRNLKLAEQLTREAYDYAKKARDNTRPDRYQNSKNLLDKSVEK